MLLVQKLNFLEIPIFLNSCGWLGMCFITNNLLHALNYIWAYNRGSCSTDHSGELKKLYVRAIKRTY